MSLTAVVPVWNGRELLDRLLSTLAAQTRRPDEVLVVDNGSTDGAPDLARQHGARVIPMGVNAGFAPAVNRGIRESRSEWIAVLNSDVELAPDYFEILTTTPDWFATGKILQIGAGPARIDSTFDLVCRGGTAWRAGNGRLDGPVYAVRRRIWSPPWTAAVFRAAVFSKVGLLEESFESYLEDVDFGLRCHAHGVMGEYIPKAIAWHIGSATLGRWHPEIVRRIARNQLLLVGKHYRGSALLRFGYHIVIAQTLWGAVAMRHGAGWAWLRGRFQGCAKFMNARRNGQQLHPGLPDHLRKNEAAIRELQRAGNFDSYWKMYFLLTTGGTK
jgi:GT2 family glycosyltransferase